MILLNFDESLCVAIFLEQPPCLHAIVVNNDVWLPANHHRLELMLLLVEWRFDFTDFVQVSFNRTMFVIFQILLRICTVFDESRLIVLTLAVLLLWPRQKLLFAY